DLKVSTTDEFGATWLETFDSFGRPAAERDPNGNTVNFSYGPFSLLYEVTDAANSTLASIRYDARGRRRSVQTPETGLTLLAYTSFGDVKGTLDAEARRTAYRFDRLGRQIRIDYPGGGQSLFTWDGAQNGKGALAQASSPDGIVATYTYDVLGRSS